MPTVRQWMTGLFKLWDAARRELLRDPNVTLFERCADHAHKRNPADLSHFLDHAELQADCRLS